MEHALERAVVAVPLVLVPALGLAQGGYQPDAWVWSAALAAWACGVAVVVTPAPGALRRAWPWLAAAAALLGWTLLSATWSARAAQSVLESRRTLLYAAVILALVLLVRRNAARLLVPATHVAVTVLLAYALVRYLLGARHFDEFEGYLLSRPLGYANGVGILAALGLLLAFGLAAGTAPPARRAAAAASVPVLALALALSGSNASWLALGAGIAVTALLAPATSRLLAVLAVLAPPAAVAVWLASYSRLTDGQAAHPRAGGAVVGGVALACAAVAALAIARAPLPGARPSGRRSRRLVLAAVLVLALGGAAAAARSGSTEPRASYFHVAWHDEYLAHPLLGTGAATFGGYWLRFGKPADFGGALDAHSLYLETLAELGPVGLLLLLALLLAPLRGVVRHRAAPYVPAAAGAYAAFLVHAGLDWDWELPAVVVAALCCAAAVAAAELGPQRPLGRKARGALLAAAFALGACALAGVRSDTVPSAAPETAKAPPSGAFVQLRN